MTPAELDRWAANYSRNLDHRLKREKMKRETDDWIRNFRKTTADMRRKEEYFSKWWAERRFKTCRGPIPVDVARLVHQIRVEQDGIVLSADQPFIARWRTHVEAEARQLGVTIEWEPRCAGLNAYAWPTLKRAEFAPITSAGLYATALHEIGHVARPCEKTHTRVKTETGTLCVQGEIDAWRWAIDRAQPTWTRPMHDRLAQALPSYRQYGTPSEQREIDELASGIGFHQIQLRRAS